MSLLRLINSDKNLRKTRTLRKTRIFEKVLIFHIFLIPYILLLVFKYGKNEEYIYGSEDAVYHLILIEPYGSVDEEGPSVGWEDGSSAVHKSSFVVLSGIYYL